MDDNKISIKGLSLSRFILDEKRDSLNFVHYHEVINKPVVLNLSALGSKNVDFRHGIITYSKKDSTKGKRQIFSQCLKPGGTIDLEVHDNANQLFWVVEGECEVYFALEKNGVAQLLRPLPETDKDPPHQKEKDSIDSWEMETDRVIKEGRWFLIPAGYWHSVRNTSTSSDCKLITFYDAIVHDYFEIEEKKHEKYNGIGYVALFKNSKNKIELIKIKSIDQLDIPNLHYSCFWKFQYIRYVFEIISKNFPELNNSEIDYSNLLFENYVLIINNSIKNNSELKENLIS